MEVRIVALMIGRGGSSLKDKNVLPVLGYPLLQWAGAAAQRSRYVSEYYVSSDDEKILSAAEEVGYFRIKRPDELASDTAQSCDTVRHAMSIIEVERPADIVLVQHANVGTISEKIIDDCIEMLLSDETLSSVVPSHEYNEYHPMRAKGVTEEGLLKPFFDTGKAVSANRQDLPKCYFFDHSVWALRGDAIRSEGGQGPWECMGNRIKPYVTEGCLDVHTMEDIKITEQWIKDNKIPYPL